MGRILIVGAGLTGCLLSVYLARRGYRVDVYERHGDPREACPTKRPSLNLTLCERGLRALEEVGLREAVLGLAVAAQGRRVHALDGTHAYQPYGNAGEAIHSISRSNLNDALIEAAEKEPGVRLCFQHKCVAVDLQGGAAEFEDAEGERRVVQADRIIGADGAYSAVRLQMQKTERFDYSQQYWPQGYKSLRLPPGPDGKPQLTPDALHVWPRGSRMLMGFPNKDGSTTCSLLLPYEGEDSYESLKGGPELIEFFRRFYPDMLELIPDLVDQFFAKAANSLVTIKCRPWFVGERVLLVGDAAHAILPSYGQGANAGFEDCRVLNECLEISGEDWPAAMRRFEELRRPNLDVMADLCLEHFAELCDRVADPAFLRRRAIERQLEEVHPDLYQPLYSMITFSELPYAEAVRRAQARSSLVDRIVAIPNVEAKIGSSEIRRLLESEAGKA
jgi:kynurenine 3-monooxygenase